MRKQDKSDYDEIKFCGQQEKEELQKYVDRYNKQLHKNDERMDGIKSSVKYVLFTPLSIAARVMQTIFKILGSVTAIGIPYGLYSLYKVVVQLQAGGSIFEIKHTTWVCLFLVFPFIAFALSRLFEAVADHLVYSVR